MGKDSGTNNKPSFISGNGEINIRGGQTVNPTTSPPPPRPPRQSGGK
jgi:hypothetical protein